MASRPPERPLLPIGPDLSDPWITQQYLTQLINQSQGQAAGSARSIQVRPSSFANVNLGDLPSFGIDSSAPEDPYADQRTAAQRGRDMVLAELAVRDRARSSQRTPAFAPDVAAGDTDFELTQGDYRHDLDPARAGLNAKIIGMLAGGAPDKQIRDYLANNYIDPRTGQPLPTTIEDALDVRRQRPKGKIDYVSNLETIRTKMGRAEANVNCDLQSPIGAMLLGETDALSGGGAEAL